MEVRLPSLTAAVPVPRPGLLDRAFLAHPRSLGEGYWQHQQRALGFGMAMLAAGVACVIHAIVPLLFAKTASSTIMRLHERMRAARRIAR
jgi:uncharacterized protein DUF6356